MSKKKSSKSVIVTIVVTLVVLCALTYAGIKFLLPVYAQGQNGALGTQYEIYQLAVKIFPLLVGLVLIIIASLIASGRDREDGDEEDKLPPNSYETQLFETPDDDPVVTEDMETVAAARREDEAPAEEMNTVAPEKENEQFVSIFDAPSPSAETEESAGVEELKEAEDEPWGEAEPKMTSDSGHALLDAIYALSLKIDNLTNALTYEDDYKEEDPEDDEDEYYYEASSIDGKIDRIVEAISGLAEIVKAQSAVALAPVMVEAPESAAKPAPAEEKPAKVVPRKETVEVPSDVAEKINDDDASDPLTRARIEFDSAKEDGYDISYAVTGAPLSTIKPLLGEIGDAYEINGKTLVVVPFLDRDEAAEELDKLGVDYKVEFVAGGADADFNKVVVSMLS